MANDKRRSKNPSHSTARQETAEAIGKQASEAQALNQGAVQSMLWRLGLIAAAIWVVGGLIAVFSQGTVARGIALGVPAVLTMGLAAFVIWILRRTKSAQGVAGILANVRTPEDRQRALTELDQGFKAKDPAAVFAKAQLQMQEDPRAALATLEQIDLKKGALTVADEARAQRGMIHLMLGEATAARDLADSIDLSRHQDARSRAMMASVIAEAWARTGQAKKGLKTIELFNPEDDVYENLRPQLYRARAFAFAYTNNAKAMKRALKRLAQIDARLLGGLLVKKTHPLLQKEARTLLEQSGQVQRRMQIQR